jgi:hypothetical protein
MKLRIRGDSIRLRLGRSEVQRFLRDGQIEEVTHFPKPQVTIFAYGLRAIAGDSAINCVFDNCRLTVWIPREAVRRWATSEEVSIRATQPIEDGGAPLKILIEKDFECLDGSSEDCQDDAFANPRRVGSV